MIHRKSLVLFSLGRLFTRSGHDNFAFAVAGESQPTVPFAYDRVIDSSLPTMYISKQMCPLNGRYSTQDTKLANWLGAHANEDLREPIRLISPKKWTGMASTDENVC